MTELMLNKGFIFFFLAHMTGLGMKFFRLPYHTIIMAVGAVGILIIGIIYLIKKDNKPGLLTLTTAVWSLYLISVVKFLPQTYFLAVAIVVTSLTAIYLIRNTPAILLQTIASSIIFLSALTLALQAKDERYYLLNIKYNNHVKQDYWAWDKYSWFLNQEDKNEEALKAISKASLIVSTTDDKTMKDKIRLHQDKLRANNWEKY